jgi:hypothetical protein
MDKETEGQRQRYRYIDEGIGGQRQRGRNIDKEMGGKDRNIHKENVRQ